MTPENQEDRDNALRTPWWLYVVLAVMFLAIPGGVLWAWWINAMWPMTISVIAFILFYAG
jgi:hypothetical protein